MASLTRQDDSSNLAAGGLKPKGDGSAGGPQPTGEPGLPARKKGPDSSVPIPPKVDYKGIQAQRETTRKPGYFTIYKRGQGYATRMGTIAGAAILAAVTAYFLYNYLPTWLPTTWPVPLRTKITYCAVTGVILLVGLITFIITNRPNIVDFLIATDSEMKKVNWTTRAELIGSTKVVILFVVLICIILFAYDTFFGYVFYLFKVLQFGPFG
jgi:preprotein translocase subunit SecE